MSWPAVQPTTSKGPVARTPYPKLARNSTRTTMTLEEPRTSMLKSVVMVAPWSSTQLQTLLKLINSWIQLKKRASMCPRWKSLLVAAKLLFLARSMKLKRMPKWRATTVPIAQEQSSRIAPNGLALRSVIHPTRSKAA